MLKKSYSENCDFLNFKRIFMYVYYTWILNPITFFNYLEIMRYLTFIRIKVELITIFYLIHK